MNIKHLLLTLIISNFCNQAYSMQDDFHDLMQHDDNGSQIKDMVPEEKESR